MILILPSRRTTQALYALYYICTIIFSVTENRHKFQALRFLIFFFQVFIMKVIRGTSLQKSRVLQETAAAIQQIVLLPVSPGCCCQQQLHSLEGMINEK